LITEHCANLAGLLGDLSRRLTIEIGHDIIVVKLHAIEAQRLVQRELFLVRNSGAYIRTEGISALADIPRTKGKTVFGERRPD